MNLNSNPFRKNYINYTSSDKDLLISLIEYDDIRLRISDIILTLIEKYKVSGKYRQKLLGYIDTLNTTIKTARNSVNTLEDYKRYSTHFSVVYASLLYTFQENDAFYMQYRKDIKNPNSRLGIYLRELTNSYKSLEQARKKYESIQQVNNLKEIIRQLNNEIYVRKNTLHVQRNIELQL